MARDRLTAAGFKLEETVRHTAGTRAEVWAKGSRQITLVVDNKTGQWIPWGPLTDRPDVQSGLEALDRAAAEGHNSIPVVEVSTREVEESDLPILLDESVSSLYAITPSKAGSIWAIPANDADMLSLALDLSAKGASRKLIRLLQELSKAKYDYVLFDADVK